jgi:hypothetical protein
MHTFFASDRVRLCVFSLSIILSASMCVMGEETNDLVFIHHSCGQNWLDSGLHDALVAKDYIDERNDITYGTAMPPDPGRPASLGDVPGDNTDMNHWIFWFNDYLLQVRQFGSTTGYNRIILFKSCFPNSDIYSEGDEPGNPFSEEKTLANYRAVYRHPDGPGQTYPNNDFEYLPLEDIFARHPEILFIPVTAPPLCYGCTDDANAHRARIFNTWLKTEWLSSYRSAHPGFNNVAVFDWFDFLANPDGYPNGSNRLKEAFGGTGDDSHPNENANTASTVLFATGTNNFLDDAWLAFSEASTEVQFASRWPVLRGFRLGTNYPNPFNPETIIPYETPRSAEIQLFVLNSAGKWIRTLVYGKQSSGVYRAVWDGRDESGRPVPSGVYMVVLKAEGLWASRKILLLK